MNQTPPDAKALFFAALELPNTDGVDDFLDQACGDNARLRQEVEALLHAHQKGGASLGGSSPDGETADLPEVRERPGSQIGPYKFLQQLGEGGQPFCRK